MVKSRLNCGVARPLIIFFGLFFGTLCLPSYAQQPGTSVYLSTAELEQLQQQTQFDQQAAIDAADRCDKAGYEAALDRLTARLQFSNASLAQTTATMQGMSLRMTEMAEEFRQFVPDSADKEVVDTALGKFKDVMKEVLTVPAELTKSAPLVGNVASAYDTLQNAAKRIDDLNKLNDIMGRIQTQYIQILETAISAARWKRLIDFISNTHNRVAKYTVRTDCVKDDDTYISIGEGGTTSEPNIHIGSDSPTWCSFRDGNPEPTGGDDGDDPRDAPPPDGGDDGDDPRDAPPPDGGDDPRDAGQDPCEELRFLRMHISHVWRWKETPNISAKDRAQAEKQLEDVGNRIKELEKQCPGKDGGDGDDPRDAGGNKNGDAPRDTPVAGGSTTKEKEEEDDDDPRDAPVTIYVKAKASAVSAGSAAQATAGQKIKLFADSTTNVALPGNGAAKPQTDHDEEPIQGTTDSKGNLALTVPASAIGAKGGGGQSFEVSVDTTAQTSLVATPKAALPASLKKYVSDAVSVGSQQFTVLTLPKSQEKTVTAALDAAGIQWEINYCREKQAAVNDPLFKGKGAWKQKYDNQWAIKRVGLTNDGKTAWKKLGKSPKPVIVAVIDTGLDWNHLDIDWKNLWRNPKEIPNNGKDDDRNGYIDDVIGWDFYGRHNKPWDHDGHGTIVAGIIAATQNNKVGMAGINPHAKIMVLKALNSFGHSRASYLAKAITYAVDNGARIINMSVGGKEITSIEKQAVKYAISKGVLIVVASGNEGVDVKNYGIAGLDGVLSVGATDLKDKRAGFSNWGAAIDIAAPGIDVLSLRARRTDTMRDIPGVEYKNGANYVGKDKRYYRASGTSFAAPIVAGVASLVMSKHPGLSGEEVAQILKQTADDVDTPGVDQYSGHGIVNANKALEAEAGLFITANISGVQVAQGKKGPIVQVVGTAEADQFKKATIAIGAGEDPAKWKNVAKVKSAVKAGMLGEIDANELRSSTVWIIRLTVEHKNGKTQEFRFRLSLG